MNTGLLDDEVLTVDDVARLLKVRRKWVYDAVANNRLPHTKVGRLLRFHRNELEIYLQQNHNPGR